MKPKKIIVRAIRGQLNLHRVFAEMAPYCTDKSFYERGTSGTWHLIARNFRKIMADGPLLHKIWDFFLENERVIRGQLKILNFKCFLNTFCVMLIIRIVYLRIRGSVLLIINFKILKFPRKMQKNVKIFKSISWKMDFFTCPHNARSRRNDHKGKELKFWLPESITVL